MTAMPSTVRSVRSTITSDGALKLRLVEEPVPEPTGVPTSIRRSFGMRGSVGGFLLTDALAKLGGETIGTMRNRVIAELRTTFASAYTQTIGLGDVLNPEDLVAFSKKSTGSKYLIDPSSDRG